MIAQFIIDAIETLPKFRGRSRLLNLLTITSSNVFVTSKYGPKVLARTRDFTNWAAINGAYDERIWREIQTLREGDVFIDVGANIGIWSLVASSCVGQSGKVFAFEPQAELFSELMRNARRNKCENIVAFNVGVGEQTGFVRLVSGGSQHTGLAHLDLSNIGHCIVVNPSSGMPFISQLMRHRRTILKLDVEGGELGALRGLESVLKSPTVSSVIVEIDPKLLSRFGHSVDELYAYMESFSFWPRETSPPLIEASAHFDEIFERKV